ncbi:MAG: hypothetical protein FWG45_04925, partial [Oscillospiraceae bacterium]|nr:hypothetical protein [Oscillospiraceae bacterium]
MKTKGIFKRKGLKRAVGLLSAVAVFAGIITTPVEALQQRSARIRYDSTTYHTAAELRNEFNAAVAPFEANFTFVFTLSGTASSSTLNGGNCPRGIAQICDTNCAAISRCNSTHHKSAARLVGLLSDSNTHTVRIVGHKLCLYSNNSHIQVWGAGEVRGKNSIITHYPASQFRRTIQHEICHPYVKPRTHNLL